jgi:hypothetical protein
MNNLTEREELEQIDPDWRDHFLDPSMGLEFYRQFGGNTALPEDYFASDPEDHEVDEEDEGTNVELITNDDTGRFLKFMADDYTGQLEPEPHQVKEPK